MLYSKIACVSCAHYLNCPLKTRMYVNYCGSAKTHLKKKLKSAAADCKTRGGLLFTRNILSGRSFVESSYSEIPK